MVKDGEFLTSTSYFIQPCTAVSVSQCYGESLVRQILLGTPIVTLPVIPPPLAASAGADDKSGPKSVT